MNLIAFSNQIKTARKLPKNENSSKSSKDQKQIGGGIDLGRSDSNNQVSKLKAGCCWSLSL